MRVTKTMTLIVLLLTGALVGCGSRGEETSMPQTWDFFNPPTSDVSMTAEPTTTVETNSEYYVPGVPLFGSKLATSEEDTVEYIDASDPQYGINVRKNTYIPGIIAPGTTIYIKSKVNPDKGGACTLGAFVSIKGKLYGITAGHCLTDVDVDDAVSEDIYWGPPQNPYEKIIGKVVLFSVYEGVNSDNFSPSDLPMDYPTKTTYSPFYLGPDLAVFSINPGVKIRHTIANKYKVEGIFHMKDVTPGMTICKLGSRTGETCGKLMSASDTLLSVNICVIHGDSGSIAYVKTGSNTAKIIGIAKGDASLRSDLEDSLASFTSMDSIHRHIDLVFK